MGQLNIIPGIDKGAKQMLHQDYMESDLRNQVDLTDFKFSSLQSRLKAKKGIVGCFKIQMFSGGGRDSFYCFCGLLQKIAQCF